ncbi:hypothetical protein [Rhizobacter sp. P5_C2]
MQYSARFWVQGNPDLVSATLGVAPTLVGPFGGYDYWNYAVDHSAPQSVFDAIFEFLRGIKPALTVLPRNCTCGLTFSMTIKGDGRDYFHLLEPNEMKELADMNIPVAFQVICEQQ